MEDIWIYFLFSSRRRHTRCALVTGVQTCALPIWGSCDSRSARGEIEYRRRQRRPAGKQGATLRGAAHALIPFVVRPRRIDELRARNQFMDPAIGRASGRERVWQYV